MKNFFNTLRRYRVSSILNILGLSVAFASLYIIATQVIYEFNYNKAIPEHERVYNIQLLGVFDDNKATINTSRPLIDIFVQDEPSVESYGALTALLMDEEYGLPKKSDSEQGVIVTSKSLEISESALDILKPVAVEGSFEDFDADPEGTIIVSESFSDTHSLTVGDNLHCGSRDLKIVAIYEDLPKGTDFSGVNVIRNLGKENKYEMGNFNYLQCIKFKEGTAPDDAFIRRGFERLAQEYEGMFNVAETDTLPARLMPISDLYFADDILTYDFAVQGNYTTTVTLLSIAIVLLLIAIINFINFFFALVPLRIKAVNTHKIFGGTRGGLVVNFIVESLGLTLIALLLAAFWVYASLETSLVEVLNSPVGFTDNAVIGVSIIGFAILVSIIVALYPALYITSFPAAMAIKSGFAASRSGKILRYSLIGVQYVATMILFIYTIFTNIPYRYMMDFDMGFNKTDLITTDILPFISADNAVRADFAENLKKHPSIVDVTFSSDEGIISSSRMTWGRSLNNKDIMLPVFAVDYNFLDVMGIEILEGRAPLATDQAEGAGAFVFNKALMDKYDIKLGNKIWGANSEFEVVGVCDNFTHQHLKNSASPIAFFVCNNTWRLLSHVYIRINPDADVKELTKYIQECSDELSGDYTSALEFAYFDQELGTTYAIEHKTTTMVSFFAVVSIIISLMGVFGLVLFETQFRQREIVIRRVHGATVGKILWMINRKFLVIIAICFAVAAPVSYFLVESWLSSFAYRIELSLWIFLAVLLIITLITTLIVTVRSLKAANSNPASLIGKNA